jgi:anaerobic magnesium-protoporphyrin IX monomethyl ester cyclase
VIRGEPQRIEDLDSIPLPDRSVVDNPNRIFDWVGYVFPEVPPIATMVSSRGCPFRCNFCTPTSSFACGWRGRSAENVLQELLQLAEEGFRIVISVENNFTANVARVNKLCRMIMEHGLHKKMRFFTQGMVDHVPEATLQLMHKAGFDGIYVGVESGSDAQLKRYDKATTGRRTGDGILRTKKAHMFVISSFITGGIGETDEDREETYKFVRKIKPLVCEVGSLRVHPGTPLWDELVGPEEPATIEESLTRTIDQFPGQQDEETLKRWIKDFEKVFHGTFGRGRRLREAIDLLLHNPTARWFIKTCLKHPWVVAKIIKRMRPGD